MKNILKRFLLVTQYVIFVLGICFLIGITNTDYKEGLVYGISLLILVPILKYIFIGQFLILPWSKVKVGSNKTMKDILKRLLILTHYGIFFFGTLFFIGGIINSFFTSFGTKDPIILGIFLWVLGPTLNYIFLGKFLIFPWSKVKIDK